MVRALIPLDVAVLDATLFDATLLVVPYSLVPPPPYDVPLYSLVTLLVLSSIYSGTSYVTGALANCLLIILWYCNCLADCRATYLDHRL